MLEHGECLHLLKQICDIMFGCSSDEAVGSLSDLRELVAKHHQMLLGIFGIGIAKIKAHLLFHCVDCLEKFGIKLNCFSCERLHKLGKALARHQRAGQWELYVLKRVLAETLSDFDQPNLCTAEYLVVVLRLTKKIERNLCLNKACVPQGLSGQRHFNCAVSRSRRLPGWQHDCFQPGELFR